MPRRTAPLVLRSLDLRIDDRPLASPPPRRPMAAHIRRLVTVFAAVLVSLVGVGTYPASAAAAADPEGGTSDMRKQLDEATRGYLEAKAIVDTSKSRQAALTAQLATIEARIAVESVAVGEIARNAYLASGYTAVAGVMSTGSAESFLDGMTLLNAVASHETSLVRKLQDTKDEAAAANAAIASEIGAQQEALAAMENRKQQAERALWAVGGGQETGGFSAAASSVAEPSPRSANGGWSGESCSIYEATSGGCITPRTAHAKSEAQRAGFNRYVSCYRPQEDGGEHPRGRACDFAVMTSGFGGAAEGDDKVYGTNLAAFFLFNADRLGVLYIIWYRQIWLPSSGWRTYTGCCDPSSQHTNHVHLSMI